MKVIFDRDELIRAITPALGIVSKKNTIASIEGIMIRTVGDEYCDISAYDLENGMKTRISCRVVDEGSFIINAGKLSRIIKCMPEGELEIEVDPKSFRTKITAGKAVFELQSLSGDDFPSLPELDGEKGFKIKKKDFKELVGKTLFAVSVNDARPALNGLFLRIEDKKITAVGCDGSRLALCEKPCDLENAGVDSEYDMEVLIHSAAFGELMRLIDDKDDTITIKLGRKHIIFFIGDMILFTRLIDAEYIDYERFLPKSSAITAELDADLFLSALEKALLVTEDRQQGQAKSAVICNFEDDVLTVSSSSVTGRVKDEIPIVKNGGNLEIAFNCRFLADAMKVCDTERVKLCLNSPLMSMLIEPQSEEEEKGRFLLLVLPVRLNK